MCGHSWATVRTDLTVACMDFRMLRRATMEPGSTPMPDRYRACNSLTPDMLRQFHHQFMESLYVEGLVTGNFTAQVFYLMWQKYLCAYF
jgi:hypothetical protein